jgi:hypothetical protein
MEAAVVPSVVAIGFGTGAGVYDVAREFILDRGSWYHSSYEYIGAIVSGLA